MSDGDLLDMLTPEERLRLAAFRAKKEAQRAATKARRGKVSTSRKGKKGERACVKLLEGVGIKARRQPRSGSIEGLPHDVIATLDDGQLSCEVKQFKDTKTKTLDKYRDGADMLVLFVDQQEVGVPAPEPKVFMPWSTLQRLINHR